MYTDREQKRDHFKKDCRRIKVHRKDRW